jgi:hypothetical protein
MGYTPSAKAKTAKQQNREFQEYLAKDPRTKDYVIGLHKKYGMPTYSPVNPYDTKIGLRWDDVLDAVRASKKQEEPAQQTPASQTESKQQGEPYIDEGLKVERLGQLKRAPKNAPWWVQDIISLGALASDYATTPRLKPWQATFAATLPTKRYVTPERELAATQEQANIAQQAIAQFVGAPAFNARQAEIQGRLASQASNIIATANNANAQRDFEYEKLRTDILNNLAMVDAAQRTGLYQDYDLAQYKFDNLKTARKNQVVNQINNAITNKAMTAGLNSLYPQFATDPSSGGLPVFLNPREYRPEYQKEKGIRDYYQDVINSDPSLKSNPAIAWDIALRLAGMKGLDKGKSDQESVPNMMYPGANS